MVAEWRRSTWGEEVSLEYGKGLRGYRDTIGPYRVYGSNGPVGWTTKELAPGPGIILGRKGAYRGVEYSKDPFYVIDTAYYVKIKTNLHMRWLYYAIKHYKLGEIDDGSPVPSTTRAAVYVSKLKIPPFPEQKNIAHMLGVLDDRIELNRRMNETLESMAQALFKSWFVDFDPVIDNALAGGKEIPAELSDRAAVRAALGDKRQPLPAEIRTLFPDEFTNSAELGWIPKGWEISKVKDITNLNVTDYVANGSFASLKENVTLYDEPNYALYIRTTDFKNDFSKEKAKYVDKHAYDFLKKSMLEGDDVIISNVGDTGTVFRPPVWLNMPMTLGSNAITLKAGILSTYLYYYFSGYYGQQQISGIVGGSAQPKFNKTDFRSLKICVPAQNVILQFNKTYKPLHDKRILNLSNHDQTVTIRDTLLPKLLSGELRIPDAEKLVEGLAL